VKGVEPSLGLLHCEFNMGLEPVRSAVNFWVCLGAVRRVGTPETQRSIRRPASRTLRSEEFRTEVRLLACRAGESYQRGWPEAFQRPKPLAMAMVVHIRIHPVRLRIKSIFSS